MRFPSLLLTLAGAAVLTGCSSLISLNPFVADRDAAVDPALVGTWKHEDNLYIVRASGSIYDITYTDGKSASETFEGRLIRVGAAELLDLVAHDEDGFRIPAHMLVRVWPEDTKLRWVFLDSDWFKQQASQLLATQPSGSRTLITAPADAVRDFAVQYGGDPRAYDAAAGMQTMLEKVP